jgi:glycosyltransferase involved in cell wall biosynthesis
MLKPNVSIIVPCYNAENTIKATIDSIKTQSYKDFEVILVNDGSTDNTLSIIEQNMVGSGLNFTIITHEDKGVSVARNTGIEASKGKYLMFLDADDIYHPSMVMYLVELIETTKTDTAFCSFTRNVDELPNVRFDNIGKATLLNNYELQKNLLFQNIPNGMWSFIYKKQILDKFFIRFAPGNIGEDREFTWKYLCHCESGVALDMRLYGYYDNPKSAINNVSISKIDILFCNAGVSAREDRLGPPFTMIPVVEFERLMTLNVYGLIRVTQAFLETFKAQKEGKIVCTASISGYMPSVMMPQYSMSKISVMNIAQTLAKELGPYNVNVNVLNPGFVYTPMYEKGGMWIKNKMNAAFADCKDSKDVMEKLASQSVFRRSQSPDDMANTVLFLCSEGAKEITGQVFNVDSGITRR